MYRRNSKRQIFPTLSNNFETGISDHLRKHGLGWEFADGFDEVLVRVAVFGDDVTHHRDYFEGVDVVDSN